MMHTIKVKEKYYNLIKNKEKIYEVRLYDNKRKQMKIGDIIKIFKEHKLVESLNAKIIDLVFFKSFEEMANALPSKQIGFDGWEINDIIKEYHKFYTAQEEQKLGVVAIKIQTNCI